MTDKERKDWIVKLEPYWRSYSRIEERFYKYKAVLEEEMSKQMGVPLEFFSVDGEVAGIGAWNHRDRRNIPLITYAELEAEREKKEKKRRKIGEVVEKK